MPKMVRPKIVCGGRMLTAVRTLTKIIMFVISHGRKHRSWRVLFTWFSVRACLWFKMEPAYYLFFEWFSWKHDDLYFFSP